MEKRINILRPYKGISGLDTTLYYTINVLENCGAKYKVLSAESNNINDNIEYIPELKELFPNKINKKELSEKTLNKIVDCDTLLVFNFQRKENNMAANQLNALSKRPRIVNRIGNTLEKDDNIEFISKIADLNYVISNLVENDLINSEISRNKIFKMTPYFSVSLTYKSFTACNRLRRKYEIKPNDIVFIYPTRFSSMYSPNSIYTRKGILPALDIFLELSKYIPNIKLLIGGSDSQIRPIVEENKSKLFDYAKGKSVKTTQMKFIDYEDCKIPNFYDILKISNFSFHINTEEIESFGLAAFESALAGNCLLTTNLLGGKYLLNNNENFVMLEPKNTSNCVKTIIYLIKSKKYELIAKKARNILMNYTNYDRFSNEVLIVLSK